MTSKLATIVILIMLALLISSGASAEFNRNSNIPAPALASIGTAFTYQGYITDTGSPANGSYNLEFKLYDDASAGTQVGSTVTKNAVTVSDGYFTVELDFGDEFDGTALWLEIEVQGPGDPGFTALSPRQPLTAVPYALYAFDAQSSLQLSNLLIVAKSGGDFTSIQPAIDSISDAAIDNPYLVWVAPGVYSETVTMKPYVHLQGAGREATVITSTASSSVWPPTQATLILSSDVSLRDLTLGNSGAGDSNVALQATAGMTRTVVADVTARALGGGVSNFAILLGGSGTDITLQQVTALAENGSSHNIGLDNYNGAAVQLHGGIFTGRGGENGWGIFNVGSDTTLDAENVTALGENGSNLNNGLYNYDSAEAVLRGGVFTGRGGNQTGGVANQQNSTLTAEDVTTLAENASENYSLGNYDGAVMMVRGAVVTARGGGVNYALTNEFNVTMEAESVTALAEDGSSANYGLWNVNNGQATVRGGSFTGSGGTDAYGIYNHNSGTTLDTDSVTALGKNGSDTNIGLLILDGAAAILHGGSFTSRGGTDAFGIFNLNSTTTLEAEGVTVLAESGSDRNFGLYNYGGAEATLRGGSFTGRAGNETRGIENANSGSMLTAEGVTALGKNGSTENYGLGSYDSATTTLYGGFFSGLGGTVTYGIANGANGATLEAESVSALAENGVDDNYGLHNFSGAVTTVRGGSFTGRGGTNAYGIANIDSGTTLEAESVTALGENGSSTNFGMGIFDGAATADSSQFTGSSNGLYLDSSTVYLGVSQLDGGATNSSGTLTCFQVYDGNYAAYACP